MVEIGKVLHKALASKEQKETFVPYEEENVIKKMKLVCIVVRFGQSNAIQNILNSENISISVTCSGVGGNFTDGKMFTLTEHKKSIMFALVNEEGVSSLFEKLEKRFSVSKAARGVAYTIPLTSVAGVLAYKFLSNTRKVTKVKHNGKK